MTLQQEDQPSLSSLVTSALFQNMTLQRYSRFRSHWNDEKTTETCIFNRLQESVKLTQMKFTTDLNIFEQVNANVNIPTFHSASGRFCGRSLF